MGPKGKGKDDDLKQGEILQAIVIADSFNVKFGPITEKTPRALLPLVNVPMLQHTLEFLYDQDVQEVFVFCSHLSPEIRKYLEDLEDGSDEVRKKKMSVKVILAAGSRSLGDALRDMDTRALIRNDFFLLFCDTVGNVDLSELMKEHRDRRAKIKSAAMTMTCMKVDPKDRRRCAEDNVFLGVEMTTKQICDFQRVTLDKKIKVPLKPDCDIMLHQDLMDCQLYVCSPMVLHFFTDNFDYCTLDDFIRGVIINEEIFGNTVHVNVLKSGYCARVTNPYMYDVISQDIITHKASMVCHQKEYNCDLEERPRHVYFGPDVSVPRSVTLKKNVVISKGCSIQGGTQIQDSVLGKDCTIGADVKMQNCYLWGNVTVEDGCELSNAILCNGVTVYANTTLQPHTILSYNVKVGPDITLPQGIRLQDTPQVDEFAEEEQPVPEVTPEYGAKSLAFPYTPDSEDEDSDDSRDKFSTDWGERLLVPRSSDGDESSSINSSDIAEESDEDQDEYGSFYSELTATLSRAKEENINLENLILEVNSLKHAYNIAIKEVHQAVVKVLVEFPLDQHSKLQQGKDLMTAVLRHVDTHVGLLKRYIKNKEAQWDCLHALEDFAVESERMLSVLSKVVQYLYQKDILDERIIIAWHDTPAEEDEEEEHAKIRKQTGAFVTWLKEADEESDEESSD